MEFLWRRIVSKKPEIFVSCDARIRGTHAHSFRSGEWAKIMTVKMCAPNGLVARPAFKCIYEDGRVDYIPVSDTENYEIGI